jgi:hypothetical protein
MTTLQKIKSLTWWNEIAKLKSILTDLLNSSGGGGGSQDLQSVLGEGNIATFDDGDAEINILSGSVGSRYFGTYISKNGNTSTLEQSSTTLNIQAEVFGKSASLYIYGGEVELQQMMSGQINKLTFEDPIANTNLKLPAKTEGTYILATLDDILKINLDGRIYTNNPTAISGGLSAKDIYRTATGELRIVV